ncbi:MAG TPA: Sir2 family NAD-dependent protein deacetylase [Thermotogota bacterium]|nr:Sir2 family NAD-dependent protein deacetylase [Thermotogota bacterium]
MKFNKNLSLFNGMLSLFKNQKMVILTGAGVSTDSGISDFRSIDGVYARWDANRVFDITYFRQDPNYFFDFAREELYRFVDIRPNITHEIITKWEREGLLKACITQNIDMLHQRSGTKNVLEIHGSIEHAHCLNCHRCYHIDEMRVKLSVQEVPKCNCGGIIKPDIVFFGETLPQSEISASFKYAAECELFITIGTSLSVYPAASLPVAAKDNGAKLVIINRDPTPLDSLADEVINGELKEILQALDHQ